MPLFSLELTTGVFHLRQRNGWTTILNRLAMTVAGRACDWAVCRQVALQMLVEVFSLARRAVDVLIQAIGFQSDERGFFPAPLLWLSTALEWSRSSTSVLGAWQSQR